MSKDFDSAIEHIEILKRNYERISAQYPNHLDPLNRYAKGYHAGYLAALDSAVKFIKDAAYFEEKYGTLTQENEVISSGNVIDLVAALKVTTEEGKPS